MRVPFFGNITQQEQPSERIEKLNRLFGLCDASRRPQEADWYANCMYLRGNQLDDLPRDVRMMIGRRFPTDQPRRKVEYVANRMLSLCRQGAAYLVDSIGRQVATPATTERRDVLSAELGTVLLEYIKQSTDARDQRFDDIFWTMVAARVLIKPEWDPDLPGQGPFGPIPKAGDIATRTLSPLHFHMDPWATKLKTASFVVEATLRDIEELKELFPTAAKDLEPEGVQDTTYLLDSLLGAITTGRANEGSGVAPKRESAILLKTWYFAPTVKNPEGLVIWQAGQKELHQSPLPEGVMPFAELVWLRMPGGAYPLPFCTPLRNPSHYMNVLRSQLIQLANAKLRGDTIQRGEGKVTQVEDPETHQKSLVVDSSVEQFELMKYELDWAAAAKSIEDMWDDQQQIAGLRASMMGENPTGVQTVGQLLLLKEPDTAGMALFRNGFESSYAQVGKLQLQIAHNHYQAQRLIRVTGEDEQVRVEAFLGSDLSGVADVVIRPMPMMSEAQKRAALQEATNLRLFGPYENIQDKRSKLQALMNSGIPGIEHDVERIAAPMSLAELDEAAGKADMLQFMVQEAEAKTAIAQMEMAANPPEQEQQDPREAAIRAMMGETPAGQPAGAAGAPQPVAAGAGG